MNLPTNKTKKCNGRFHFGICMSETKAYGPLLLELCGNLVDIKHCNTLFNAIFEVYTDVITGARKQVIKDNKFSYEVV